MNLFPHQRIFLHLVIASQDTTPLPRFHESVNSKDVYQKMRKHIERKKLLTEIRKDLEDTQLILNELQPTLSEELVARLNERMRRLEELARMQY